MARNFQGSPRNIYLHLERANNLLIDIAGQQHFFFEPTAQAPRRTCETFTAQYLARVMRERNGAPVFDVLVQRIENERLLHLLCDIFLACDTVLRNRIEEKLTEYGQACASLRSRNSYPGDMPTLEQIRQTDHIGDASMAALVKGIDSVTLSSIDDALDDITRTSLTMIGRSKEQYRQIADVIDAARREKDRQQEALHVSEGLQVAKTSRVAAVLAAVFAVAVPFGQIGCEKLSQTPASEVAAAPMGESRETKPPVLTNQPSRPEQPAAATPSQDTAAETKKADVKQLPPNDAK